MADHEEKHAEESKEDEEEEAKECEAPPQPSSSSSSSSIAMPSTMAHAEGKTSDEISAEDVCVDEPKITIVFMIKPDGYPLKLQFPKHTKLCDLQATVSSDLQVAASSLKFSSASMDFSDAAKSLRDFSCQTDRQYVVDVLVSPNASKDSYAFTLPKVLDVLVESDNPNVPSKAIKVHISRDLATVQPKYLGGFRHKVSGKVLLNAETQIYKPRDYEQEKRRAESRFHRDTQTAQEVTRSAQTLRENGTQMPKPGLYVCSQKDWEVTPKPYFDSSQHHSRKVDKTVVIQTYWRAYCARREARNVRNARDEKLAELAKLEEEEKERQEERKRREVERRMQPRSRADFEVLYNEVEHWRRHESERIHQEFEDYVERQRELEELLRKETKLLQTIDKLKTQTNVKYQQIKKDKMLEEMAAPKRWEMRDGDVTQVHTPYTIRAKALQEIYQV